MPVTALVSLLSAVQRCPHVTNLTSGPDGVHLTIHGHRVHLSATPQGTRLSYDLRPERRGERHPPRAVVLTSPRPEDVYQAWGWITKRLSGPFAQCLPSKPPCWANQDQQ